MAKLKYFVINLKNRLLYEDACSYSKEIKDLGKGYKLICAPGDSYLPIFQHKNYDLCAQNISAYDFLCTGEIGGNVLRSLKANYVLIGHSERRKLYDDEYVIEKKIKNALKNNLKVILFIGEDSRQTPFFLKELIKNQIRNVLDYVDPNERENIIIAYEPAWLIGTSESLLQEDIVNMVDFIKDFVEKKYFYVPIVLYGGGISNEDIKKLLEIEKLDGIVVSSVAVDIKYLKKILK